MGWLKAGNPSAGKRVPEVAYSAGFGYTMDQERSDTIRTETGERLIGLVLRRIAGASYTSQTTAKALVERGRNWRFCLGNCGALGCGKNLQDGAGFFRANFSYRRGQWAVCQGSW